MSQSSKRAHAADDLSSPPDAKRAAIEPSSQGTSQMNVDPINVPLPPERHREPPHTRNHIPEGILTQLAGCLSGPAPCHDDVHVIVNTENYIPWFHTLYETIVYLVYPDFDPVAQLNVITEANFTLVCRYLMKARVDNVYGRITGRRPPRRIPIPLDMLVPNALAIVINAIGVVTVDSGAYPVIPQPEAVNVADVNENLDVRVTHNILGAFTRLITAAANRGLIRTGFISSQPNGTAYWLLSARDSQNPADVADGDANHCHVFAVFKEWTPSDALLASITLNQFDGMFGGNDELKWTTDPTRAIGGLRQSFNANA